MLINHLSSIKHPKKIVLTVVAVCIILSSMLITGCSSTTPYYSPSEIVSMENELYNLIRQQPQIPGVKYSLDGKSRVSEARFTLDGMSYLVAFTWKPQTELLNGFFIWSWDEKHDIMSGDGYLLDGEPVDGIVDIGMLSKKTSDGYNRFFGINPSLVGKIQKVHNEMLVKILKFFKQQ
jgi:hypothetical protein